MKDIKNISVIVQSRLNSSRVPRKMIRPFAGTTLVDILLQKLSNSKVISPSQVYFCVGDEELIQIGKNYPVNIFERSEESLNEENNPKTQFEWRHSIPTDYIVMVSACNPLISIDTIDKFITQYAESEHEGALSVYESKNYFWNSEGEMLNKWPEGFTSMNTKFVDPTYVAAHCMYGSRVDIIDDGYWVTDKIPYKAELITMPEIETFDIDYEWQFKTGEILYENY